MCCIGQGNRSVILSLLDMIDEAVVKWLQHSRLPAHVISDDPNWASAFVARMRAQGIATSFRPNASLVDDLSAMAASRVVVRAALSSQFSRLACSLSGVPLVAFHTRQCRYRSGGECRPTLDEFGNRTTVTITEGSPLINVTYIDLERFLGDDAGGSHSNEKSW